MVSDTVLLEVPADASLLPVVRMVIGGMSARADLTLSEMDELFMAVEEVLRAGYDPATTPRYRLAMRTESDEIHITMGPFGSPHLLENLGDPCCNLILSVVEHDVQGDDDAGSHSVVLTKRRRD